MIPSCVACEEPNFATRHMLPGWRKSNDWKRRVKSKYLRVARIKNGGGKNKGDRLIKSVKEYLEVLEELQDKVALALLIFRSKANDPSSLILVEEIRQFHDYLIKHIDLIIRRLIHGETIPHEEKVFSLFEPHTEWITKGKSRPNVELGHRLLITTNQHGLIVDHQVMESITDSEAVPELIDRLSDKYAGKVISSHSFDKGFYSASNKQKVGEMASVVVMPKKGKRNLKEQEEERGKKFKKLRNEHSAVESDINCLEHHGLDRCPDKGLANYKRYVALGVLTYNLHKIGNALLGVARGRKKVA